MVTGLNLGPIIDIEKLSNYATLIFNKTNLLNRARSLVKAILNACLKRYCIKDDEVSTVKMMVVFESKCEWKNSQRSG